VDQIVELVLLSSVLLEEWISRLPPDFATKRAMAQGIAYRLFKIPIEQVLREYTL
jgi:hypothetical protein